MPLGPFIAAEKPTDGTAMSTSPSSSDHLECFCLGISCAYSSCPLHKYSQKKEKDRRFEMTPIFEDDGEDFDRKFEDLLNTTWPFAKCNHGASSSKKSLSSSSYISLQLPAIQESMNETETITQRN